MAGQFTNPPSSNPFPGGYPLRGEIYTVDFNPTRGSEQAGRRPALVVSNNIGNRYGAVVTVAPITSTVPAKAYPTQVHLFAGQPLPREGTIYCQQIRTIAKDRLENHLGSLTTEQMMEVDAALREVLAL